jgi:hypothetical protein
VTVVYAFTPSEVILKEAISCCGNEKDTNCEPVPNADEFTVKDMPAASDAEVRRDID